MSMLENLTSSSKSFVSIFTGGVSKRVLMIFCISLLCSCKSLWLYFPSNKMIATPEDYKLTYEEIFLDVSDGARVHAWFISSPKNRGTILFCHGNAGNISGRIGQAKFFAELGFNTLLFDYREYGKSIGTLSEEGTFLDAERVWNYLISERKLNPDNIIIWGRSLGGAVAIWLAHKYQPALLVTESTFKSLADVTSSYCVCLFPVIFVGDDYNSIEYIKSVKSPTLFVHSRDDDVIPFSHGEELYKNSKAKKEFIILRGSHNSGVRDSMSIYKLGVIKFLKKYYKY